MNLDEVFGVHEIAVDLANARLQAENRLVCWNTQINDAVVQADVLPHYRHLAIFFFLVGAAGPALGLLVEHLSTGIFQLEGQVGDGFVNAPDFLDLKLDLL